MLSNNMEFELKNADCLCAIREIKDKSIDLKSPLAQC